MDVFSKNPDIKIFSRNPSGMSEGPSALRSRRPSFEGHFVAWPSCVKPPRMARQHYESGAAPLNCFRFPLRPHQGPHRRNREPRAEA